MDDSESHFSADNWYNPLTQSGNLSDILAQMEEFKLDQEDVPLIIKLVENPKYKTSEIFSGAVDLFTHDCIHVLLGRGLLAKDEAFVIGYTMGSAKKMTRWRRNLFMFCCKHLYPEEYRFGEEERYVFYSGVMGGSHCGIDLTEVDFTKFLKKDIEEARLELGIDSGLLKCYYCAEKKLFPNSKESQRL